MENLHQVICEKKPYSREFKSHQHGFGQFLFPLEGSLDVQTKWQEINLTTEYCFYIPPNCDHHYHSKDRNEFLILDIPIKYLPEDTSSMYINLNEQWASIRYLLLDETNYRGNTSSLTALTKYVTSKLQTMQPPSIDFIHKHFKQPMTLETLARIEHYHPVYYSTWFKKKTGKSPMAYISELRLKEAKQLLTSTSWSMSRISEEVGFEYSSSFTRWFVNWVGISPQNYRNLNNEQKEY